MTEIWLTNLTAELTTREVLEGGELLGFSSFFFFSKMTLGCLLGFFFSFQLSESIFLHVKKSSKTSLKDLCESGLCGFSALE